MLFSLGCSALQQISSRIKDHLNSNHSKQLKRVKSPRTFSAALGVTIELKKAMTSHRRPYMDEIAMIHRSKSRLIDQFGFGQDTIRSIATGRMRPLAHDQSASGFPYSSCTLAFAHFIIVFTMHCINLDLWI